MRSTSAPDREGVLERRAFDRTWAISCVACIACGGREVSDLRVLRARKEVLEGLVVEGKPHYNMRLPLKFWFERVSGSEQDGTLGSLRRITGARREWEALEMMLTALDDELRKEYY
jgi:hypothetical protein